MRSSHIPVSGPLSTQCAAVRTQYSSMMAPPQRGRDPASIAIHGNLPACTRELRRIMQQRATSAERDSAEGGFILPPTHTHMHTCTHTNTLRTHSHARAHTHARIHSLSTNPTHSYLHFATADDAQVHHPIGIPALFCMLAGPEACCRAARQQAASKQPSHRRPLSCATA